MANIMRKLSQLCPCRRQTRPENRTVFVGNKIPDSYEYFVPENYPSNRIVSSKYTAWNFLPKNLFEQFHRIANFYFLLVAIVELFVHTSVSAWTSILPLIFVVLVTMVKQGYEDLVRHKADREVNNRECLVLRNSGLEKIKAMQIQVGDIVKVSVNSDIPCDIVLLSSSEAEGNCYITTANLDGETNLKIFSSLSETRHLQTETDFDSFYACIECQQPITDLYRFVGRINIHDTNGGRANMRPLVAENVILRGARLKNTQFIYGCAVYTGQDTKISLNSKYKSHKYSRVERKMNTFLIVYLVVLASYSVLWVCFTLWFYSTKNTSPQRMWYVGGLRDFWTLSSWQQFIFVLEEFLSYMVLCNYIIPISMYVTVELQKFFGSMFFESDVEMFDELTNEPAKAITSDLNEELGQVEYLFTDKTGTLTENDMEFRQCSVGGVMYEDVDGRLCIRPDVPGVTPTPIPAITPDIERLFIVLALCHTVRIDRRDCVTPPGGEHYSRTGSEYDYQSSSPDEKALVQAAARFGVVYHGVKDDLIEVTVFGRLRRYRLRHVLDFDSIRKRMSTIVEDEEGRVFLLCKGAETAVFERITDGDVDTVDRHINDFAVIGLRTLVIAEKELTTEEFLRYDALLTDAKQALDNREEKLAEAYNVVENHLRLVGATAIEDKLQDGVPSTIEALRAAGIQVWVLTGDKEETAVNISYSAGHFNHDMLPLSLTKHGSGDECEATLESFRRQIEDSDDKIYALVVDGKSLVFALEYHSELLRTVCEGCVAVLCCRMSPIQKALVVKLMKNSPRNPTTAAIGDGANDVSMIQEAHVGLGIMGKEGRQAVRSSDYAFGRFRFLRRALLVHGHYFYLRIAILVQYFFYKNVAMITVQLYLTFFSAFSAQSLYSGYYLVFFNITFTALPVFLYGLFEKHVPIGKLVTRPALYKTINGNELLSNVNFLKWNLLGLWHSIVAFFGTYFALSRGNSPFTAGWDYGLYDMGTVIMTICVITVNIKMILVTHNFNGIVVGGFLISFAGFFIMTIIQCIALWPIIPETLSMHGSLQVMLNSGYVWLLMLLLTVTSLLPDILLKAYEDSFISIRNQNENEGINNKSLYGSTSDLLSAMADGRDATPLNTITSSYNGYRQRAAVPESWIPATDRSSVQQPKNSADRNGRCPVDRSTEPEASADESQSTKNGFGAFREDDVNFVEISLRMVSDFAPSAPRENDNYAYDNVLFTSEV